MTDVFLASLARTQTIGLPLTLTVGTLLVRGELTTHKVYIEAISQMIVELSADETTEISGAGLAALGAEPPHEIELNLAHAVIHLANVSIVPIETDAPMIQMPFWRGQLAAVSGWTIGHFPVGT
jgi:hypothetical protein